MLVSTSTLGGHVNTSEDSSLAPGRRRRAHSDEFKADCVAAAVQPGVSTAAVALSRGINANLLRRWIRESQACVPPPPAAPPAASRVTCCEHTSTPAFVPLAVPAVPSLSGDIRIELHRNATTITLSWPIAAAGDCASWLRDLLR
jgi:transposase